MLFAQAGEAIREAGKIRDGLGEAGPLGYVIFALFVLLFAVVVGGGMAVWRVIIPAIIEKLKTEHEWLRAKIEEKDAVLDRRAFAHETHIKEQAAAFLTALDRLRESAATESKAVRADIREEVDAVVEVVREGFTGLGKKIETVDKKLDTIHDRLNHPAPKRPPNAHPGG